MKEGKKFRAWWRFRHTDEAATLRETVAEYHHMRNLTVEFLSKFESRGTKMAMVNWIYITKSINLLNFFVEYTSGTCVLAQPPVTSPEASFSIALTW